MIKKLVYILLFFLMLIGCQSESGEEIKAEFHEIEERLINADNKIEVLNSHIKNLSQKLEMAKFENENLKIRTNEINEWIEHVIKGVGPCVWEGGVFERPVPSEIVTSGTAQEILANLNEKFRNTNSPEAILLKIEDGTAYIEISDDEKLTQGMGTSGAANYLNSITYTLLSIKDIKNVRIDFEEGDHAF